MKSEAPTDGAPGLTYDANNAEEDGPIRVGSIDKSRKRSRSSKSSLDVMEEEIRSQISLLPSFAAKLRQRIKYRRVNPSEILFTGSGDSFASSLYGQYLTDGQSGAADPYELWLSPRLVSDRIVYITSVSGRTRANLYLARRIKRFARRRVAITANIASPLARECDEIIRLPYEPPEIITPGTISFTMSLLAITSRIRRLPPLPDLDEIDARAKKWARQIKMAPREKFVFVGSGIGYALSAYGAFKVHEVLGESADYEHTEQLGHSKLFSLHTTDNIVCLASSEDRKTLETTRILSSNGFHSHLLATETSDPLIAALETAFYLQHLALTLLRKKRLEECAFLTNKKTLRLSSRLIY